MTRILHLALLLIPTVLSERVIDRCSKDEFVCLIRDKCTGEGDDDNKMVITKATRNNYVPTCDMHVMIKQYNASSYYIRFITSANEVKLSRNGWNFGFRSDKTRVFSSNSEVIKLREIEEPTKYSGDKILCAFSVVHTEEEVFPEGKEVILEYNNVKLTIEGHIITGMTKEFEKSSYKCNPDSIQYNKAVFGEHDYFIQPIFVEITKGSCADKNYKMAFVNSDGKIEDAEEITCAMEKKNECESENPPTCEWKYHVKRKRKNPIVAPDEFKVACRRKACKMCKDKPHCKNCNFKFTEGDCNTLECAVNDKFEGKSIVSVDGNKKRQIGKFQCSKDNTTESAVWTFQNETFKTASCFDTIECDDFLKLNKVCLDAEKKEGCPEFDIAANLVKCPLGFDLEVDNKSGSRIKPFQVQCDMEKGRYHYRETAGDSINEMETNPTVYCAREDAVAAATGMPLWQWISIGIVAFLLIVLLILCIVCVRRSKKKEEERKALLKRNDSAPSSNTESGQPQLNRNPVLLQPCSTAKPISSEQISEATAIERTKKEFPEKTMIEPTLDLATAYSHDKSRQSKRETGSIEAEVIDDGKRSRSQKSDKIPDREESAPSMKFTQTSKKESGKDDKIKPKKFELNEKEKQIAKGVWRRNEDYPTMADIESDWDDAKDGKPPSKSRTATKDIPTADTPSARVAKIPDLNEKTAEMERLIAEPLSPLKLQRVSGSEDPPPALSRGSDSRASVRRTHNKMSTLMASLDATQDQK